MSPPEPVVVRSYRDSDADPVRRICCDTAWHGQPIDPVFSDRDFLADSVVGIYSRTEPESFFIAESGGKVVGYITGCRDTKRFARRFVVRALPGLIVKFFIHGHWFRPASLRFFFRQAWAGFRHAPDRRSIVKAFPAHCHINVDPGFQHGGVGSALFHRLFEMLREAGVAGIHIGTGTDAGKAFFTKEGFSLLTRYRSPSHLGQPPEDIWVMGRKAG